MRRGMVQRTLGVGAAMALALGVTALGVPASSAAGDATVYVVQGLPGMKVEEI